MNKKTDQFLNEMYPRPFGKYGKIWVWGLSFFCVLGLYFYIQQLNQGLSVTGLGDYTTWGIYVSNFVFFVAISLVGSLISAILKLSGAKWRIPITRIAEIIAVASIAMAGIVIIIDMGRPDRMLNLLFHPRIQSPIIWDVIVISTYLALSILFLYLPLIPDFAVLRDRFKNIPSWQHKMYKTLAMNWQNTNIQKKILSRSIRIIAIIIIPVGFFIHTVTSWLFATTFRPGWDSASVGPYFVAGAFMVGAASVICAMYVFKKAYKYDHFFNDKLFDNMGRLLLLLSFIYLYFNINEYFIPAYKMKGHESSHLDDLFSGHLSPLFWFVQIGGMVIPIIILMFKKGRKPLILFILSIVVIVGAWYKRFLIVVPTLSHPLIPHSRISVSRLHYFPTIPEWFITISTLSAALLIMTLFVRFLPVIPIVETAEELGYNEESLFDQSNEKPDETGN